MLALGRPQYFQESPLEGWGIREGLGLKATTICRHHPIYGYIKKKRGVSLIYLLHLRDAGIRGSQIVLLLASKSSRRRQDWNPIASIVRNGRRRVSTSHHRTSKFGVSVLVCLFVSTGETRS